MVTAGVAELVDQHDQADHQHHDRDQADVGDHEAVGRSHRRVAITMPAITNRTITKNAIQSVVTGRIPSSKERRRGHRDSLRAVHGFRGVRTPVDPRRGSYGLCCEPQELALERAELLERALGGGLDLDQAHLRVRALVTAADREQVAGPGVVPPRAHQPALVREREGQLSLGRPTLSGPVVAHPAPSLVTTTCLPLASAICTAWEIRNTTGAIGSSESKKPCRMPAVQSPSRMISTAWTSSPRRASIMPLAIFGKSVIGLPLPEAGEVAPNRIRASVCRRSRARRRSSRSAGSARRPRAAGRPGNGSDGGHGSGRTTAEFLRSQSTASAWTGSSMPGSRRSSLLGDDVVPAGLAGTAHHARSIGGPHSPTRCARRITVHNSDPCRVPTVETGAGLRAGIFWRSALTRSQ